MSSSHCMYISVYLLKDNGAFLRPVTDEIISTHALPQVPAMAVRL
jgi:hypothetical protein